MLPTKNFTKTLLATSMALTFALAGANSFAQNETSAPTVYVDPVTGEVKEIDKLLSDMTPEEKAQLSPEEVQELEAIEAQIKKNMEMPE